MDSLAQFIAFEELSARAGRAHAVVGLSKRSFTVPAHRRAIDFEPLLSPRDIEVSARFGLVELASAGMAAKAVESAAVIPVLHADLLPVAG